MRVNYAQAVYGSEEIQAVVDVLENSPELLMTGPNVSSFEAAVAALFGKSHGVMVNSGSSANLIAVAASRLPERSEVITPALTFSTTVAPIVQSGLTPVFVDVESDTFNADVQAIDEAVSERTSAIMVPNLIGNLPDWAAIRQIAARRALHVIEDSCDTVGSTFNGAPTADLTDISTTSFYASHIITAGGFGGMMTTSDPDVADRARLLRGWGRASSLRLESEHVDDRFDVTVDGVEYDAKFLFSEMGYNFLPSEISAAFGLVQLGRLPEYIDLRRQNFAYLLEAFTQYENWFVLPRQTPGVETAWLAFPLVVRSNAPFSRRQLQTAFENAGVQTRVIFTGNILRQPGFASLAGDRDDGRYPNTDRVMTAGVLLGCHQGMGIAEIDYMMDTFETFVTAISQ